MIIDPILLKTRCEEAARALATRTFATPGHRYEFICTHIIGRVLPYYTKQGHKAEDVRAELVTALNAAGVEV